MFADGDLLEWFTLLILQMHVHTYMSHSQMTNSYSFDIYQSFNLNSYSGVSLQRIPGGTENSSLYQKFTITRYTFIADH